MWGRPTTMEQYERISSIEPAGVVATACRHSESGATRGAPTVIVSGSTGNSRETGRAVWGGGEVRSTVEAR